MIRTNYDNLIAAIDNYREIQANRERDVSAPGHYDPCGTQTRHYEHEIQQAERQLDDIFETIVQTHQSACACPDQPFD